MASMKSVGRHTPVALPYLVAESIISADASPDDYIWETYDDAYDQHGEEEVLSTDQCVIWSQGGTIARVFKFAQEEGKIDQAILTWLPSDRPSDPPTAPRIPEAQISPPVDVSTASSSYTNEVPRHARHVRQIDESVGSCFATLTRAVVIFIGRQAHVNYISGASYVVRIPFDLDRAFQAPKGLVLQRHLAFHENTPTPIPPPVPPTSFLSSQFSVSSFSGPHVTKDYREQQGVAILSQFASRHKIGWGPELQTADHRPRLYSFTDPLGEIGLVGTLYSGGSLAGSSTSDFSFETLSFDEELLYLSSTDEMTSCSRSTDIPLIIALTLSREKKCYTLWQARYVESKPVSSFKAPRPRSSGMPRSRRRSSYAYRNSTGTTTPAARYSEGPGSSFPGPSNKQAKTKMSEKRSEKYNLPSAAGDNLASQLQDEVDMPGRPSASDRRTSSRIARSELSTQDQNAYSDLGRNPAGAQTSFRGQSRRSQGISSQTQLDRTSLSRAGRLSGRASTPGSISVLSEVDESIHDMLEEDLHDELTDDEIFADLDYHQAFESLPKEMTLTRLATIPIEHPVNFADDSHMSRHDVRVFTVAAPSLPDSPDATNMSFALCIMDYEAEELLEIGATVRKVFTKPKESISKRQPGIFRSGSPLVTVHAPGYQRIKGVVDAIELYDGRESCILALVRERSGPCSLRLHLSRSTHSTPDHNLSGFSNGFILCLDPASAYFDSAQYDDIRLAHSQRAGFFDIIHQQNRIHRFQIKLHPRSKYVMKVLDVLRLACSEVVAVEANILPLWWVAYQMQTNLKDVEWRSLVVTILSTVLRLGNLQRKSSLDKGFDKAAENQTRIEIVKEADVPPFAIDWLRDSSWNWTPKPLKEILEAGVEISQTVQAESPENKSESGLNTFIIDCVHAARQIITPTAVYRGIRWPSFELVTPEQRQTMLTRLLFGLHLLREEQKLDISSSENSTNGLVGLAPVIAQIGYWYGWTLWSFQQNEYYYLDDARTRSWHFDNSMLINHTFKPPSRVPPSINAWLEAYYQNGAVTEFPSLSRLSEIGLPHESLFHTVPRSLRSVVARTSVTPRLSMITSFLMDIRQRPSSSVNLIETMHSWGIGSDIVETLPEAVATLFKSAIAKCQVNPPTIWPRELLHLVGRSDLERLSDSRRHGRSTTGNVSFRTDDLPQDVRSICEATSSATPEDHIDDLELLTRTIFRQDKRLDEATKLLNSVRPATAVLYPTEGVTEAEFLERQKFLAHLVYHRTMALPSGQAILGFNTKHPTLTDKVLVRGFTTSCVIHPSGNTINADRTHFTEEKVCWAWFHAGVEAGLCLSRDSPGLDTSWFVLNKPDDLGNRHAGLLLALGLNGHFKTMAKWLAFKYLTEKHNITTVALLIGLSASSLGTMDTLTTKILSVHVQCLLPHGAANVNLSSLTQTAGVIGIGLLYYNTQHRRMSEVMLSEIEKLETEDISNQHDDDFRNEGYRLAAGFSLGLINLARGSNLTGLHDMHVTERLLAVATGPREHPLVHIFDQATAGAIMAIALIFMKSHDETLAAKIDAPRTVEQFDYIRPDMLLLRKLAAKLIMWDTVEPSFAYVKREMPFEYKNMRVLSPMASPFVRTEDLPFFNIFGGILWSIGLKFAGTGNIAARDVLMTFLDRMHVLVPSHEDIEATTTWDLGFARAMIARIQRLIAISAATVMSGSGDLDVFRRLRRMYGDVRNSDTFGCQQAAHQAIGILFMGKGRFAFSSSNLAIASMLISFYPLFPQDVLDNQAHLQALRHLWVFAAEARCLIPRDVETEKPLVVPIRVVLRNGEIRTDLVAPCLLPEIDTILRIESNAPEYWTVTLDFANNKEHIEAFRRHQSIWLRRKSRIQAHDEDIFRATLEKISDLTAAETAGRGVVDWLFKLPGIKTLGLARVDLDAILVSERTNDQDLTTAGQIERAMPIAPLLDMRTTELDDFATLLYSVNSDIQDRLLGLRILFAWAESTDRQGKGRKWLNDEKIQKLKSTVVARMRKAVETRTDEYPDKEEAQRRRQSGGERMEMG